MGDGNIRLENWGTSVVYFGRNSEIYTNYANGFAKMRKSTILKQVLYCGTQV